MKVTEPQIVAQTLCVIDKSASMASDDYQPSRLEAAKAASLELVQVTARQRPQDQVGIIGFDSNADLIVPLSPVTNVFAFQAGIRLLQPGTATDFANALMLASQVFAAQSRPRL